VPLSVTSSSPGPLLPGSAVEAITDAVADRFSVSDRVLWGNVGSAANSAARLIGVARPELADSAMVLADSVLADSRVDGGVLRAGPDFRRHSCCLIYRLDNNRKAVCGDCVLG
ncbi:MAG TPA: (2Fe-2S)-binding protein, partial [Mycobacterium sp.]|nr:(2Fe-2S)-binding protein [Mycobacterium sp.]